jgi:sugar phosphate isomerase/epimerase
MQFAIAQVSSLPFSFADDVAGFAAGGCHAIEVWLTKLEDYLKEHSRSELDALLDKHGMALPVASLQGGLLERGPVFDEAWSLFCRRLTLCRDLGISTLVVAADVSGEPSVLRAQQVIDCLRRAADQAAQHRVRLALEFRAASTLLNNLETTIAILHQIQHPHLGLCLDVVHLHVGPSKYEDLRYLRREDLFHVQLADLADVPRELASDADRILPGEGDIGWGPILHTLKQIDYQGTVAIELMNPRLWQTGPRQLAQVAMACLERLFAIQAADRKAASEHERAR